MAGGRRCARPGCRAWAMRDAEVCYAHRGWADGRATTTEPEPDDGSARLLAERVAALVANNPGDVSLTDQLAALQVALVRVLTHEADPRALARDIPRIVDATVRALRAQQTLDGAAAQTMIGAVTAVLLELGLGEER